MRDDGHVYGLTITVTNRLYTYWYLLDLADSEDICAIKVRKAVLYTVITSLYQEVYQYRDKGLMRTRTYFNSITGSTLVIW